MLSAFAKIDVFETSKIVYWRSSCVHEHLIFLTNIFLCILCLDLNHILDILLSSFLYRFGVHVINRGVSPGVNPHIIISRSLEMLINRTP